MNLYKMLQDKNYNKDITSMNQNIEVENYLCAKIIVRHEKRRRNYATLVAQLQICQAMELNRCAKKQALIKKKMKLKSYLNLTVTMIKRINYNNSLGLVEDQLRMCGFFRTLIRIEIVIVWNDYLLKIIYYHASQNNQRGKKMYY